MKLAQTPVPDGATVVRTLPFVATHQLLADLLDRRGGLEISGEPGSGKTFAVDAYFASVDVDLVKIHLASRPTGYGFLRKLVLELGGDPARDDDGDDLMAHLRAVTNGRRLYAYVDEADLLNVQSLRQIRYIRDQRDIYLAWVLVGSDFQRAYKVCPELRSRLAWRVCFDPAEGDELLAQLAGYHPFLAGADPALLLRIDREHCRGNWRLWSETLITLLDYAERQELATLTETLASQVLGISAGRPRKPKGSAAYHRRKAA